MALKPAEQAMLNGIETFAQSLHSLGHGIDVVETQLSPMIQELEKSANCKLIVAQTDSGFAVQMIDLKSDFVRTRQNTGGDMLSLRAKIMGVPVDVKLRKDDAGFAFTNEQVAKALRELAVIVEKAPVEMVGHGQDDWSRTPGEMPKSADVTADDTEEGIEEEAGDQTTALVDELIASSEKEDAEQVAPAQTLDPIIETAVAADPTENVAHEDANATQPGEGPGVVKQTPLT